MKYFDKKSYFRPDIDLYKINKNIENYNLKINSLEEMMADGEKGKFCGTAFISFNYE